jgi:hypothetical protein
MIRFLFLLWMIPLTTVQAFDFPCFDSMSDYNPAESRIQGVLGTVWGAAHEPPSIFVYLRRDFPKILESLKERLHKTQVLHAAFAARDLEAAGRILATVRVPLQRQGVLPSKVQKQAEFEGRLSEVESDWEADNARIREISRFFPEGRFDLAQWENTPGEEQLRYLKQYLQYRVGGLRLKIKSGADIPETEEVADLLETVLSFEEALKDDYKRAKQRGEVMGGSFVEADLKRARAAVVVVQELAKEAEALKKQALVNNGQER